MQTYTRLNQIPKSYFNDMPLSKAQAKSILCENNKSKRDFSDDNDLKAFLTNKYIIKQIDIILAHVNNKEIKNYLIMNLLSKMNT